MIMFPQKSLMGFFYKKGSEINVKGNKDMEKRKQ